MLPAIDVIAASIRTSRAEFGRIFLQAQIDVVPNPNDRVLFAAVTTSGVDTDAFAEALRRAQAGGWLDPLVRQLVAENLESGALAQALAAEQPDQAALQAMASIARGLSQPHLAYRGFNSGMQWTTKILIDGTFTGTGVLISPNLVLTAWHVVQTLFRPVPAQAPPAAAPQPGGAATPMSPAAPTAPPTLAAWEPVPGAGSRLRVEFGDFLTFVGARPIGVPSESLKVPAHDQWCVVFSRCHDEELASRLPADVLQLDGFWDYAVIRLAKAPGIERSWALLDERAIVPKADSEVIVFQHPAGQPLRFDQGGILKPDGQAQAAVPRLRFLHGANAVEGTSGGPCFDKTFMLFGLHQGVWKQANGNGNGNGNAINRGVPVVRVLEHIKAQIQNLPPPDQSDMFIWQVVEGDYAAPIIGCDAFQSLVWRAALTGTPRIIEIAGTPGSGKTFQLSVLSAVLPTAGHLKAPLAGRLISKMNAPQLAAALCQAAGAPAPVISPPSELNATATTWLRDVVVQQVITSLDEARNGRLVWILISDLNTTEFQGEHASELLLALYEQTRTVSWLRFVLDGMRGDIPSTVKPLSVRHRIVAPTRTDIEAYVRRAVTEDGVAPHRDTILALALQGARAYQAALDQDASTAMERLAEKAMTLVEDYMVTYAPEGQG